MVLVKVSVMGLLACPATAALLMPATAALPQEKVVPAVALVME